MRGGESAKYLQYQYVHNNNAPHTVARRGDGGHPAGTPYRRSWRPGGRRRSRRPSRSDGRARSISTPLSKKTPGGAGRPRFTGGPVGAAPQHLPVMAQAVQDVFRGEGFDRTRPSRTGSTTTSTTRRRSPRRPREDRGADARDHRRRPSLRARGDGPRGASESSPRWERPTRSNSCATCLRTSKPSASTRRGFVDLCRSPHLPSTGRIAPSSC